MDIYPKCYWADKKLIVLENLVMSKGFILPDKENLQDFNAAQFALTALAKHQVLSYAYMKDISYKLDDSILTHPRKKLIFLLTHLNISILKTTKQVDIQATNLQIQLLWNSTPVF